MLTLPGASYLAALDHITKLKYSTLDTVLLAVIGSLLIIRGLITVLS